MEQESTKVNVPLVISEVERRKSYVKDRVILDNRENETVMD